MKFEVLAGKRILGNASAKDYTGWAESLLYENVDSKNVAILAGLGLDRDPDPEDVEFYFKKCIQDLGLELPSDKDGLKNYTKYLCRQIIDGGMPPQDGVGLLEPFYYRGNYKPLHSIWSELAEDVRLLNWHESCIFNTGLTEENMDQYIKDVAAQFIELSEMELPERFFSLCACPECGHIGEGKLERIDKPWLPEKIFRALYGRGPTWHTVCAKCRAPFPRCMGDYEGRKQYLKQQG